MLIIRNLASGIWGGLKAWTSARYLVLVGLLYILYEVNSLTVVLLLLTLGCLVFIRYTNSLSKTDDPFKVGIPGRSFFPDSEESEFSDPSTSRNEGYVEGFLGMISVFCIVFAFPLFLVIRFNIPKDYKYAIKLTVLLLSLGTSIAYFIKNKDKFPSLGEKIGYLTGATVFPNGVLSIILDYSDSTDK